jgi:hypothetical protein
MNGCLLASQPASQPRANVDRQQPHAHPDELRRDRAMSAVAKAPTVPDRA